MAEFTQPESISGENSHAAEGGDGDHGSLSLDALSRAYAELIDGGDDPYHDDPASASEDEPVELAAEPPENEAEDDFEVCPRSIVEAILFVGHPQNEPITSKQIAVFMRGVRPAEVDDLIAELNESYAEEHCPYLVRSEGAGYRMELRPEMASLRERFYGRVREARLSQGAIDVLAIVAYNQSITRPQVEKLRDSPSGGLLRQLVRRGLLRLDRVGGKPKSARYSTTVRFLDILGIDSLDDLPRSE